MNANYEYATDYLYEQEIDKPSVTKGEALAKTFDSVDLLEKDVMRRARCILGMRGIKNPDRVRLNMTSTNRIRGLTFTEDQLADIAREVASDTQYWDIEYF
ncbi:hypothetical protein ST201phi2-1p037 [Pseudomonas phage 201phi2-1]|uniref:Uncharacterized protein n=1 Tax=Pseudomonas phage 201phi2-1 TaxID=198110 RepID=B3FK12_BP201|nr:hypothetical protein ST201phi2-1p037 [Pseudomonas phage 201phi2-1]ABY62870.1 hypothetical protein 201phi2-1p037 [Pseudomonas phage 201phi2-1]